MTNKRGQKPGIQRGNRQRFPYEPRVIGGKLLMPAELTIHRFVVETPVLKTVTDEIRAVVETVWPELISKLSTKALRRCSSSSAEWAVSRIYKTRAAVPAIVVPLDGRAIPMDGRSDRLQGTSQRRSGSRSPTCASTMMLWASAVRMGSSQPGVEPSEASAISRAIPI
jgi:hypothetical protein